MVDENKPQADEENKTPAADTPPLKTEAEAAPAAPVTPPAAERAAIQDADRESYWKANVRLLSICLVIWFVVSFGFGILLAPLLNHISLGGYPLGFWFAQQGSIYVFLLLILFYAWRMGQIDRKFNVHED